MATRAEERRWTPGRGTRVLRSLARRGESRQHSCQPPTRHIFLRSSDHRGACRRGSGSRSLFPRLASRLSEMRFAPSRKALCSSCAPTAEGHASAKIASFKLTKPYPYGPGDTFDPTCASGPRRGRQRGDRERGIWCANLAGIPFVDDCTGALPWLLRAVSERVESNWDSRIG